MVVYQIPEVCLHPEEASDLTRWAEARMIFRLHRSRSIEADQVIALVEVGAESFVRRSAWNHPDGPIEAEHCDFSEAPMSTSAARALHNSLKAIRLAPYEDFEMGVDGTSFSVASSTYGGEIELSWWQRPPPSWSQLEDWFALAWGTLESKLPELPSHINVGYRVRY